MATKVTEARAPLLSDTQMERYGRQVILEEMGLEGQAKLLRSKVLIIGAGGLGSPVALYLAAAGVGTLGIVDGDRVDLSNLHRQILHPTPALGQAKTESARRTLGGVNPDVTQEDVLDKAAKQIPAAIEKMELTDSERAALRRLLATPKKTPAVHPDVTISEEFTVAGVVRWPI